MWNILSILALIFAGIPALVFLMNLTVYRRLKRLYNPAAREPISVLIPARNEANNLEQTLRSLLANRGAEFEVIVLDDHSQDQTADIVRYFAEQDRRVRLEHAPELPPGWCGKQHACAVLAGLARNPILVFMDADVRLAPDALVRMRDFLQDEAVDLASGVPRQVTTTFSEKLLLPLIHYVLLGFLPMPWARRSNSPAFAAGCGQLLVVRAEAYRRSGGHGVIRNSLHDGIKLPRAFRRAGLKTGLFDATDLACCRMYSENLEVWRGLGKNAIEGIGARGTIIPMTVLLLGAGLLPVLLLAAGLWTGKPILMAAIATGVSLLPRLIAWLRFKQPLSSALLHPLGVLALLGIQWWARMQAVIGRPAIWKGREYYASPAMARTVSILIAGFLWASSGGAEAAGKGVATNTIAPFRLKDQFGNWHRPAFTSNRLSLLIVADKDGSAQVDGWIKILGRSSHSNLVVQGVADVSNVPGIIRSTVASRFRDRYSRPILLDWKGDVVRGVRPRAGVANVYLLGGKGEILYHTFGQPDTRAISELNRELAKP